MLVKSTAYLPFAGRKNPRCARRATNTVNSPLLAEPRVMMEFNRVLYMHYS